ncbi:hypothetical protein MRS76_11370 [Rhizobiaceae bacterium n13]|uniref:hypothetical protein n=1 Tax=Ferirhizobium litorale TaxID=2927786 RepID=UPI0024B2F49E|nr:hypothetical protein [Fererhizobium litorale]MDI7862561.1 hypothetical protein [Fererhizobium litorale]
MKTCPECRVRLNAGRVCEICNVEASQIDMDCQMAIEHLPGAVRFSRPDSPNPSKRLRSDGNV